MVFETLLLIGLKVILKTVQFGSSRSYNRKISCGVPEGSILGPLLFIVYVNDLPTVSSLIQSLLFADDTSILCSHKDPNQLISIVTNELPKIDLAKSQIS